MADTREPASIDLVDDPAANMSEGLEDDNSTDPPVEKVEGVKGDAKKWDQGVVPCRENKQDHYVDDGQVARATTNFRNQ